MSEMSEKDIVPKQFVAMSPLSETPPPVPKGEYAAPSPKAESISDAAVSSESSEPSHTGAAISHTDVSALRTAAANAPEPSMVRWAVTAVAGLTMLGILASVWSQHLPLSAFVITGNRLARTEAIEATLSSWLGRELSKVSLAEIEETLQANVLIKRAIATKEFPNTIRVQIVERQFVALTVVSGQLKLVGDDGLLADAEPAFLGSQRLPILSGFETVRRVQRRFWALDSAEVQPALQLLTALQSRALCRAMLSEVKVAPHQLVAFATDANTRFIFGTDGDYERKLDYLETFWKEVIAKKGLRTFEYVDLRYDKRVFAKPIAN
ncbi:MAG: FtsQ-type POTRA domain-containing protein [Chloroherpetonaceae bacterium]|nr:FtsQ-type POTRA domain-containing protein [Chloroherpetonaceae bacterium]MDW8020198.1 FtsQ-type POTRA domain-containing protein [Chloroherpetonaceae bacterium]